MAAPESRHDRGLSVERAGLRIDARNVVEFLAAREGEMLVPGEDHVDPVDLREVQGRVLLAALSFAARDARMAQRHDDVGAGFLDIRHMLLRRIDDVRRRRLAVEMGLVPLHDLRRHEADHADFQLMRRACLVDHVAIENEPRLLQGLAIGLDDIGADEREFRRPERVLQEVETVVEFVVAERAAIVIEGVHGGDHRMDVAFLHAAAVGDEIAQGRALNQIAVVEQQAVLRLGAGGLDEGGRARKADRVVGRVAVVVVRQDVHVEIGRLQDAQLDDRVGGPADARHGREGGGRHAGLKDPAAGDH